MKPYLQFKNITKIYPGVTALNDVSLSLEKGEVHAFMGANGAGKSTLIKMLSGAEQPSSGIIEFEGEEHAGFRPDLALNAGIGVVYQENNLVPSLSVMENIFIGHWIGGKITINKKEMRRKAVELMKEFDVAVNPDIEVGKLSPALQQIVEIVRIVSRSLKILVLDEPTAPLTTVEVEILFKMIEKLKNQGITIIYVSHRIEEIFQITDRVSVLRDGCYIGTVNTNSVDRFGLIKMMVGKEVSSDFPPALSQISSETVLKAEQLCGNGVLDISFELKKGEILGFAGLVGCGRTELMNLIFGDVPIESGDLYIKGKKMKLGSCHQAIDAGLGLIPEDRKAAGLFLDHSVKVNVSLSNLLKLSHFMVIDRKMEQDAVDKYSKVLQIKVADYEQHVDSLSGGNQQKAIIARWLLTDSEILIFDEPTRGIDVAAKQEIYKLMRQLVAEGKSILMVSSDMDELLGMADRLVVLSEGRKAGELTKEEYDTYKILDMASGER